VIEVCFFYALSHEAQRLQNRYNLPVSPDFEFAPVYYTSGFEFPRMPVITNTEPDRLQLFSWGLIPACTKTSEEAEKIRSYTLNARSDSLFVKPSFKNVIRKKRCLVPASGFYEWREMGGRKYPYFIYLKDQEIFSLAGLWEEWVDKATGELVKTYSIITTEANPLMARIHNTKKRMPVILLRSDEEKWLEAKLQDHEIAALTRPIDEDLMAAHTIGKLITSRTGNRNVPAVQEPFDYGLHL